MDILNFISWIAGKKRVVTTAPDDALVPIGIRTPNRDDKYTTVAIKKSDLIPVNDCPVQLDFKEGSIGPKVSFRKKTSDNPNVVKDIIIPGQLEITRGTSGGGIYNIAIENSFNSNNSPENTGWATKYNNPTLDGWAPLWNIGLNDPRTYDKWRQAIVTPEGDPAPPQYVGMPVIMQFDNGSGTQRYWLIQFTEWGVGSQNQYGFAYDRWEIFPEVSFTKPNYSTSTVDVISTGVHIARADNGPLYNAADEPDSQVGASPSKTRWNSIYTDSRTNYSGYNDLSNLESRVYTDFALALDYNVGSNILNTDLIMHDLTTDLYYRVNFDSWTSGNNGGGFSYRRTLIPQSCSIKFADGTVINTATSTSGTTSVCCSVDAEGNFIAADSSNELINIGPGGTHDIPDFSGMLIVNDHNDGGVELWIAGGGNTTVLVSSTPYGPGAGDLNINGGINGYTWKNTNNQAGPFTFTVIKTRLGA